MRSAILCLRGGRSARHRPVFESREVAIAEARIYGDEWSRHQFAIQNWPSYLATLLFLQTCTHLLTLSHTFWAYARTRTPAHVFPAYMHAHTFPCPVDYWANLLLLFYDIIGFQSGKKKSKTRRLRSALRIVIQEYGDRNWLNQPQSASDARVDDDRRSNRPTPTHRFCHSLIFRPITPYNVWFFWVSRHRSFILAQKMETFSGRFWEIPGNVLKLELLKMLIDHKNTSVFFQAVSGMSSWSFSYRWTQYQWAKNSY